MTTERIADNRFDDRFVNPSRLVYGTNAVLKVGVDSGYGQGEAFSADEVKWSVVSGSAILSTNGLQAVVTPTAASGEVIVEARFNDDEIQPRFVLPIVSQRVIPIRAFVVDPPEDQTNRGWDDEMILQSITTANEIFTQVGIRFELLGDIVHGVSSEFWSVRRCVETMNSLGIVSKPLSSEAHRLCDYYQSSSLYTSNDCVEVYFIGKIVNDKAIAFQSEFGIVISRRYGENTLAHELGHALGLSDCYRFLEREIIGNFSYPARVQGAFYPVNQEFFCSGFCDWGRESAHGFYSSSDTRWMTMENFLMFGVNSPFAKDIPDGQVLSVLGYGDSPGATGAVSIGAAYIKTTNEEVYTK